MKKGGIKATPKKAIKYKSPVKLKCECKVKTKTNIYTDNS